MRFMLEGVVAGRSWGSAEVQGGVVLGIVCRLRAQIFRSGRLDLIQLLLLSLSMISLVARHAIGEGATPGRFWQCSVARNATTRRPMSYSMRCAPT
jgi:hypothetical protein